MHETKVGAFELSVAVGIRVLSSLGARNDTATTASPGASTFVYVESPPAEHPIEPEQSTEATEPALVVVESGNQERHRQSPER